MRNQRRRKRSSSVMTRNNQAVCEKSTSLSSTAKRSQPPEEQRETETSASDHKKTEAQIDEAVATTISQSESTQLREGKMSNPNDESHNQGNTDAPRDGDMGGLGLLWGFIGEYVRTNPGSEEQIMRAVRGARSHLPNVPGNHDQADSAQEAAGSTNALERRVPAPDQDDANVARRASPAPYEEEEAAEPDIPAAAVQQPLVPIDRRKRDHDDDQDDEDDYEEEEEGENGNDVQGEEDLSDAASKDETFEWNLTCAESCAPKCKTLLDLNEALKIENRKCTTITQRPHCIGCVICERRYNYLLGEIDRAHQSLDAWPPASNVVDLRSESRMIQKSRLYKSGPFKGWMCIAQRYGANCHEPNWYAYWYVEPSKTYRMSGSLNADVFRRMLAGGHTTLSAYEDFCRDPKKKSKIQKIDVHWALGKESRPKAQSATDSGRKKKKKTA